VTRAAPRGSTIWLLAAGYFGAYVPYAALTKGLTGGAFSAYPPVSTFAILPSTTVASLVGMFCFVTLARWWRHASHRRVLGVLLPCPTRWTFLSGVATAAIIVTTTLSYSLSATSILFMMVLMRGGVLAIAPIVDAVSRRKIAWASWIALSLSVTAVALALLGATDLRLSPLAIGIITIYIGAYFLRLRFMSHLAKSGDPAVDRRYFVEEQMVATPVVVLVLLGVALLGRGTAARELAAGFADLIAGRGPLLIEVLAGLCSQATGVFGALVLLSREENSFCIPINRASSVLAGFTASALLGSLAIAEVLPASLLLAALGVLAIPVFLAARRGRHEACSR
jgi:hypothetical protein